ncbi:MAG: hypothetical protein LBK62_07000 [Treponema sp.]|jgi:hypothetical protein|nr:hypothetical protein [Treponema sp.]
MAKKSAKIIEIKEMIGETGVIIIEQVGRAHCLLALTVTIMPCCNFVGMIQNLPSRTSAIPLRGL